MRARVGWARGKLDRGFLDNREVSAQMNGEVVSITLLTAGLGSLRWRLAAARLTRQARKSNLFNHVIAVTDIGRRTPWHSIFRDHEFLFTNGNRGYGYWLWKPLLINYILQRLPKSDLLVYLDAGCELNITVAAKSRFHEYIHAAQVNDVFAMKTEFPATRWTKGDLFALFDMPLSGELTLYEPGFVILKAGDRGLEFTKSWSDICLRDEYRYIDDSPSRTSDSPDFLEHRHDQSVFSMLYEIGEFPRWPQETYFGPDKWQTQGRGFPIWVTRNSTPFLRESGRFIGPIHRCVRQVRPRRLERSHA